MNLGCRSGLVALLLAVALGASPSFAVTIIDSFDDSLPGGSLDALAAPNPNTSTQTGLGSTLGGQRHVEEFLSLGVGSGTSIGLPGSGTVSHNNGPAEISNQTYVYGFSSDLNADLSGESAFLITDVSGLDLSDIVATLIWSVELTITVESGAGSASSSQTLSADGDYLYSFGAFAGVDFSDVDKITFLFDDPTGFAGGAGADYTLTNLQAVPEPSTALLVVVGLVGLAASRQRVRR